MEDTSLTYRNECFSWEGLASCLQEGMPENNSLGTQQSKVLTKRMLLSLKKLSCHPQLINRCQLLPRETLIQHPSELAK
jgi:hypothetical protein